RFTRAPESAPAKPPSARVRVAVAAPAAVLAVGLIAYNAQAWRACAAGRAATHMSRPEDVAASMQAAIAEDTYVAELLRRMLAGPVLDRLQARAAEDPAAFAGYVRVAVRELEAAMRDDPLDPRIPTRLGELYIR